MRAFGFLFSFLFLIQLNAAAICSVYCEATAVPPCHQQTQETHQDSGEILPSSCCDGVAPCATLDEQSHSIVLDKNHSQQNVQIYIPAAYQHLNINSVLSNRAFTRTHYSINGPPLYLLYSQLKIPYLA